MIQIENITKSYSMGKQDLLILKGISLNIEDGDFVAIMGPSGSGKSTLMNILGLLDTPSSGSYKLNDIEVAHMSEDELALVRREQIGFIFQQFNLLPRLQALENVALPLLYSKKFPSESRAHSLLKLVNLEERIHHKPNELSGGQQQRVAIARSLVNAPKIIFADEPTGNLDSKSQKDIMQSLLELNQQGITIVIVTHEEEVAREAARLIRVRDGLIQSDERIRPIKKLDRKEIKHEAPLLESNFKNFISYFQQGFRTLLANKVRTALSMLGILIGVAAVVAMMALGRGAQRAIEDQLASLGSNLLMIYPGAVRVGGVTQESGAANRLSYEDLDIIKSRVNSVTKISGQVSSRAQISANAKNWNSFVQGTSSTWASMHNSIPKLGRFYTEDENIKRARVALIGETVRRELFADSNAIGEMIKINRINFQIIGILPEKGGNGWRDQDDIVLIPVQTGMKRLMGRDFLEMIEVEIDKPENLATAQDIIKEIIISQHKIPLSQQDDAFQIRNMADIQAAVQQSSKTMSLLLSTIAAISLLVGGIGIMNIMLVSVTERTREIGLRKAVGAKRRDILFQFLSESVVVSTIGGLIGIFLGWFITFVLTIVTDWSTSISVDSILISFFFSAFIGILFGVYPARKASLLNPIDALRYE